MLESGSKINIRRLSKEELDEHLRSLGLPRFRSNQIWDWLYKKGVSNWSEMTNLSKDLRAKLSDEYEIHSIELDEKQISKDGTIKSRFRLHDGHLIEAVLIPVPKEDRYTVCVSSQVGCSLSCKFCATGLMGRVRNLHADEIYDQVRLVNEQCLEVFDKTITNIVYMGMGEPLLAYKPVVESIRLITYSDQWNLTPKKITVSTAGIAKAIYRLADEDLKVRLALSLHAADDEKRNNMMAINETNNLEVLIEALSYYYSKKKERLTYEYILFDGINDSPEDANNLAKLCRHFPVQINIIEYNTVEGLDFQKPSEKRLNQFIQALLNQNVYATVRRSRGKDIDAACGQLANK